MAGTYLTGRRLFTKPTFSFQAFVGLALITFLATTSGFTFFGIGAPFWGLVAGAVSNFILFGNIRNLRKAN